MRQACLRVGIDDGNWTDVTLYHLDRQMRGQGRLPPPPLVEDILITHNRRHSSLAALKCLRQRFLIRERGTPLACQPF